MLFLEIYVILVVLLNYGFTRVIVNDRTCTEMWKIPVTVAPAQQTTNARITNDKVITVPCGPDKTSVTW